MAEEWRLRAWRLWGTPGESAETEDRSVFIGFTENFGKPRLGQRLLAESENRTGSSSLAAGYVCESPLLGTGQWRGSLQAAHLRIRCPHPFFS